MYCISYRFVPDPNESINRTFILPTYCKAQGSHIDLLKDENGKKMSRRGINMIATAVAVEVTNQSILAKKAAAKAKAK